MHAVISSCARARLPLLTPWVAGPPGRRSAHTSPLSVQTCSSPRKPAVPAPCKVRACTRLGTRRTPCRQGGACKQCRRAGAQECAAHACVGISGLCVLGCRMPSTPVPRRWAHWECYVPCAMCLGSRCLVLCALGVGALGVPRALCYVPWEWVPWECHVPCAMCLGSGCLGSATLLAACEVMGRGSRGEGGDEGTRDCHRRTCTRTVCPSWDVHGCMCAQACKSRQCSLRLPSKIGARTHP